MKALVLNLRFVLGLVSKSPREISQSATSNDGGESEHAEPEPAAWRCDAAEASIAHWLRPGIPRNGGPSRLPGDVVSLLSPGESGNGIDRRTIASCNHQYKVSINSRQN